MYIDAILRKGVTCFCFRWFLTLSPTNGTQVIRWFINLLYGSTPAEFPSDFSLGESVNRLSAVIKRSAFQTLLRQAAVGKVSESRVSLRRDIPFIHNSFKPFFVGEFRHVNGAVVLCGKFTMHWTVKAFLSVWFGFLLCFAIAAPIGAFLKSQEDAWFFLQWDLMIFFFGIAWWVLGNGSLGMTLRGCRYLSIGRYPKMLLSAEKKKKNGTFKAYRALTAEAAC